MDNSLKINKLERQAKEVEKRLSGDNFKGLVDRNARKRDEDKLKKLNKEIAKLKKQK